MTRMAERFEDMSVRGRLRVFQQDGGDMLVTVVPDHNEPPDRVPLSVEFCTSGGKSPRTLAALRALMEAMAEDNRDRTCGHRRGEKGLGVDSETNATNAPAQAGRLLSEEEMHDLWVKHTDGGHFDRFELIRSIEAATLAANGISAHQDGEGS